MGRESRRRLLYAAGGAPPAAPPRPLGPGQVPPLDVSAVRRLRGPLSVSVARPNAARPWAPPLEEGGGAETDVIDGAIERALRCRGNLWSAIGAERDATQAEMRAAIRAARRATHTAEIAQQRTRACTFVHMHCRPARSRMCVYIVGIKPSCDGTWRVLRVGRRRETVQYERSDADSRVK